MNKKIKKLLEPNLRFYFILLVLFAILTFFADDRNHLIAYIEAGLVALVYIYSKISGHRRKKEFMKYLESVTQDMDTAAKDTLQNFPLPMAVISLDDNVIISANQSFKSMTGDKDHVFERRITDLVPDFESKWMLESKSECPTPVEHEGRQYRVFGSVVRGEDPEGRLRYIGTTYWMDETEHFHISAEFKNSQPVFAILMIDNYDELIKNITDKEKSALISDLDDRISDWAGGVGGYLNKYDRDRYIFLFEERHLKGFVNDKFSLLDSAKEVVNPKGIPATVSIGIGRDGSDFSESFQFASLGIDMALSRGGDQAVIKNRINFEFFGGHTSDHEKNTKVRSRVMANSLSNLMSESTGVYVMGHKYADLDSVGSAVGICCAARKKGIPARIVLDEEKNSSKALIARIRTLPEYADVFIGPHQAMLEVNSGSLLIVVDTNRPERVEAENLLMSCNRVAIIDHHRRAATYIQNAVLTFHEPYASSASELVTELLQYILEPSDIMRYEAEALLAGIVLDTKSFTLRTGSQTFEAAAFLRRAGADTTEVKRLLQSDLKTATARYAIIQKAKIYKDGIAIAATDTKEDRVIAAQAADELLNISGIQTSFVLFRENDAINISARSIGRMNVQVILEKLGGGGNRSTAGVQLKGLSMQDAVPRLMRALDEYLAENTPTTKGGTQDEGHTAAGC
ncbi:MAG: DHH family phosphoesterase [Ruminococcaceae bacterium]|nr:DHH family phosphoesterase [Oscillospiraceae bacterium]